MPAHIRRSPWALSCLNLKRSHTSARTWFDDRSVQLCVKLKDIGQRFIQLYNLYSFISLNYTISILYAWAHLPSLAIYKPQATGAMFAIPYPTITTIATTTNLPPLHPLPTSLLHHNLDPRQDASIFSSGSLFPTITESPTTTFLSSLPPGPTISSPVPPHEWLTTSKLQVATEPVPIAATQGLVMPNPAQEAYVGKSSWEIAGGDAARLTSNRGPVYSWLCGRRQTSSTNHGGMDEADNSTAHLSRLHGEIHPSQRSVVLGRI